LKGIILAGGGGGTSLYPNNKRCRNNDVKNLAFVSSSSMYGLNQSQSFKTTDKTEHQLSLYAATKKSNEMMAHTYADVSGLMNDCDYKPDTDLKDGIAEFVK
jgi:nucleoside-diphosphate-sugar epimerase